MEGEKEERRSRFAEILRKLHSKIVQEKEESFASKANFIPVRVPVEVFRRNRQQLIELYDISDGPAQHRASQSVDGRRFADKVTGTAIKPAARILAIILSVYHDRPFQLDSNFWQTFSKRCVDPQHSGVLDDGRLPFSLPTARELIIDAEYGELFFSRQHMYCAPIIQEGASQSLDHQAPLPYLEETLIGSGHYGTVYAVKVERSHFRFTTDHSPKVTYLLDENVTLARKDIKLRSQKSPEDTKEWNIFQEIRGNRHKYDEHVTRILACLVFRDKVSLFMWKADSDLARFMEEHRRPDYGRAQEFIGAIGKAAGALQYLHDEVRCYHLDIKPENILVIEREGEMVIFQLADFSISRVKGDRRDFQLSTMYENRSTERDNRDRDRDLNTYGSYKNGKLGEAATCIPPEVLLDKRVDERSDVWGFGCVLCIYLSWLCCGPECVKDFAKERGQAANAFGDRFVDTNLSLNSAVTNWLVSKCEDTGELAEDPSYRSVYTLLVGQVMLIDAGQRCNMERLHARLSEISSSTKEALEAYPPTRLATGSNAQQSSLAQHRKDPPPVTEMQRIKHIAGFQEGAFLRPDFVSFDTTRGRGGRQKQTGPSLALQPFARSLRYEKHINPLSDVLEHRRTTLHYPVMPVGECDIDYSAQRTSFVPWKAASSQKARAFMTSPDNTYVACLHESCVTVFKVTNNKLTNDLESSNCVLVTCHGRQILDCALGNNYLSLLPTSKQFELVVYDLLSLFPQHQHQTSEQRQIKAHIIKDVRDSSEQAEKIAQHPNSSSTMACLYRPNARGVRTLYLLDLNLDILQKVRRQNAQYVIWKSTFTANFDDSASTDHQSHLNFTLSGTRLVWTVKPQGSTIDAHVHSWQTEQHDDPEPRYLCVTLQSSTDSIDTFIDCLHLPNTETILAVNRHGTIIYDMSGGMSGGTRSNVALPDECLPISALVTNDFTTFYVVQGQRGGELKVFNVSMASSDASVQSGTVARAVVSSVRSQVAGDELSHVLLLQTGRVLQLLLIWDCQYSLLVSLQRGPEPLT